MIVSRSNSFSSALFGLACFFFLNAALAGQSPGGNGGSGAQETQPAQADSGSSDSVALFPHTETGRYWISGQANSILQTHGHFHSPYEGKNSLIDDFEAKASEVGTLYLGYQLWPNSRYNTDLIVDFENAGGRGISQALGLAGETNLDVVRNTTLSTVPYLARGEIHQIIGLTDEMTEQERGPFALATRVPVRRFEIRVGKMTLPDTFDVNSVRNRQPSAVHQLDDRQQRRVGLRRRYARLHRGRNSGVRRPDLVGALRPLRPCRSIANGITLDWAFSRANGQKLGVRSCAKGSSRLC